MSGPIFEEYLEYYHQFIVEDDVALKTCFLGFISAYTSDPVNIFIRGESSIGKTWIPTIITRLFPPEDVWTLGGLSPKALIHMHGTTVDGKTLEPLDLSHWPKKDAPEEEKEDFYRKLNESKTLIELGGKIILFLEAPYLETFNVLRPILSHDKKDIEYKYADKDSVGRIATRTAIIRGWPATIFCTTNDRYLEELATRSITLTPTMKPQKYIAANRVAAASYSIPPVRTEKEIELCEGIKALKMLVGSEFLNPFASKIAEIYPHEFPRCMRDFKTLLRLSMAATALNFRSRPFFISEEKMRFLVSQADFELVWSIFSQSYESTVTGLEDRILWFYHSVCEKKGVSCFTIDEAVDEYNALAGRKRSERTIRRWITSLEDLGWLTRINPETDDDGHIDKRKAYYKLTKSEMSNVNIDKMKMAIISGIFTPETLKTWLDEILTKCGPHILGRLRRSLQNLDLLEPNVASLAPLILTPANGNIPSEQEMKADGETAAKNIAIPVLSTLTIDKTILSTSDTSVPTVESVPAAREGAEQRTPPNKTASESLVHKTAPAVVAPAQGPPEEISSPLAVDAPEGKICGSCSHFGKKSCLKEMPELVRFEATFAESCRGFEAMPFDSSEEVG